MLRTGQLQTPLFVGQRDPVGGDPAYATATDIYIDAIGGSDSNDGLTAATALASWAEYDRRIAYVLVTVSQTVHLLSDLIETKFRVRAIYTQGCTVQGQRTQVATGTIGVTIGVNAGVTPAIMPQISDTAGPLDFTAHVGRQIVLTSGTLSGCHSWVLKVNPTGGGTATARVNEFFNPDTFQNGMPTAGDTFEINTLTQMRGAIEMENTGGIRNPVGGWIYFTDVELFQTVAEGLNQAIQGQGGLPILGATAVRTEAGTNHAAVFAPLSFECYGTLWDQSRVWVAESRQVAFHWCCGIGPRFLFDACNQFFSGVNTFQGIAGGANGSNPVITVAQGARVYFNAEIGLADNPAGQDFVRSREHTTLRVNAAAGVLYTLNQTGDWGVRLSGMAAMRWPVGSNCPAHYNFDVGAGPGQEIELDGVGTTAAVLGAAGNAAGASWSMATPETF